MKILALDCSAGPASAAIIEDGKILSSAFVNVKLTHSQTLLPMVKNTIDSAMLTVSDIDCFAISNGPGSFTGIRIGISAVKGLAAADKKPCIGVSTLMGIACMFRNTDCLLCAAMDARCNQVYNALFRIEGGKITRLTEDRAIIADEVASELSDLNEKIIIAGDGATLFNEFSKERDNVIIAAEPQRYQNATGVAVAAEEMYKNGECVSAGELLPFYLRLPQAERELKAKQLKGE
jgi:tRNA threonylcarbamoyladenosine biosynthesis protein TsaB